MQLLMVDELTWLKMTPVSVLFEFGLGKKFILLTVISDKETFGISAQTPNPKFLIVPFRIVIGLVLGLVVPANVPIPTARVLSALPVRVNPFRSRITGPDMEVAIVIAATASPLGGDEKNELLVST